METAFAEGFKIKPMGYAWLDPETMKPHPQNWKVHPQEQIAELEKSMDEFGWLPSMLALFNKRTGRVIDAHGRIEAAVKAGKLVPAAIVDVDETTERRILASMDRVGEMHATDHAALANLLKSLEGHMPPGYSEDALEQLLKAIDIPNQLPPNIDENSPGGGPSGTSEMYKPGASVTCPECGHDFELP